MIKEQEPAGGESPKKKQLQALREKIRQKKVLILAMLASSDR
jgi:hypothetical protein